MHANAANFSYSQTPDSRVPAGRASQVTEKTFSVWCRPRSHGLAWQLPLPIWRKPMNSKPLHYLQVTALVFCTLPLAYASDDPTARLEESANVLNEVMNAPDRSIPQDLVDKAKCVVVVPNLKKGAFIVGAKYGKGFMTCRTRAGWSAPAAVRIEGGSV